MAAFGRLPATQIKYLESGGFARPLSPIAVAQSVENLLSQGAANGQKESLAGSPHACFQATGRLNNNNYSTKPSQADI